MSRFTFKGCTGGREFIYYHYYQFGTNHATNDGTFGWSSVVSLHSTKKILLFMYMGLGTNR